MSSSRKSILNLKNINLGLPGEPVLSPKHISSFSQKNISKSIISKPNSRSSIFLKMQRLNNMQLPGLTNNDPRFLSNFKTKAKPNICISELWGVKERYLRKTSYLRAYKELIRAHELEKIDKNRSARKIEKPHVEDFQAKIKIMMKEKLNPDVSQKNSAFKETKNSKKVDSNFDKIEMIIRKCSDLGKKKKGNQGDRKVKQAFYGFSDKRKMVGKELGKVHSNQDLN